MTNRTPISDHPGLLRMSLEMIASGSPAIHSGQTGDHRCAHCAAMIELAREAIGWEKWPAKAGTKRAET